MTLQIEILVAACFVIVVGLVAMAVIAKDLVKVMLSAAGNRLAETFSIWFRASLYFVGTFIMTLSDKLCGILMDDKWPSLPRVVGSLIIGTGAGIITLRAYNDSSAQRLTDEMNKKKGNGDTQYFTRDLSFTSEKQNDQNKSVAPITVTTEQTKGTAMNSPSAIKSILGVILLCFSLITANAQTNPPAPPVPTGITDLGNTILGYFSSFNTNLESTFGATSFDLWVGASSLAGSTVPICNDLGLSYDVWRPTPATNATVKTAISLENVIRDTGPTGSILSDQFGPSLSLIVHDVKLTAYLDGVCRFDVPVGTKFSNRLNAEVGIRVKKAIGPHFFLGVGLGQQFPTSVRVLSAFTGATF